MWYVKLLGTVDSVFMRPVSPHLSMYSPQMVSLSSMFHRFSGVFTVTFLIAFFTQFLFFKNYFFLFLGIKFEMIIFTSQISLFMTPVFTIYHSMSGIRLILWSLNFSVNEKQLFFINMTIVFIYFFIYTSKIW
uniref:succinate dehydrogenase subunit 3 n=1 Tax=Bostrychia tenuissima TaxID=196631 RepID=UPI002E7764BF|nr:succinate dehydrogenase subunit 3 [Bostrychia tenuissima]WQF69439.1 succinate dehydrogenase subunit 3 [Bostrychia tenuissima]